MSGYDKHPDYGGPPPTWRSPVAFVLLMVAFAAFYVWVKSA